VRNFADRLAAADSQCAQAGEDHSSGRKVGSLEPRGLAHSEDRLPDTLGPRRHCAALKR
jgi:hypothetical protein